MKKIAISSAVAAISLIVLTVCTVANYGPFALTTWAIASLIWSYNTYRAIRQYREGGMNGAFLNPPNLGLSSVQWPPKGLQAGIDRSKKSKGKHGNSPKYGTCFFCNVTIGKDWVCRNRMCSEFNTGIEAYPEIRQAIKEGTY